MVPVLRGEELRRAEVALSQMGLRAGRTAHSYSDIFPEGTVIASSPKAGRRVEKDSQVDLLVSLGKQAETYVMPELRGKRLDQVRRTLESAELHVLVRRLGGDMLGDEILEQSPFPGAFVLTGDTVEVVLGNRND